MFDFLNNLFPDKSKKTAVTNEMRHQQMSNADSIFLCYSYQDVDFLAQFLQDLGNEGISIKTLMDELDDEKFEKEVLKEAENAENVLLLATENAKNSDMVRQCMRLAHDMNKRVLVLANYSGGVFDSASWVKDWSIDVPIFYYKNDEQRAKFLSQFKETAGIMVEDGDRIGARVYVNVKANSQKSFILYKGDKKLSDIENGKVGIVRLQKGKYVLTVMNAYYTDIRETRILTIDNNVGEYVLDFDLTSVEKSISEKRYEMAKRFEKNKDYSSALTMLKMAANLGCDEAQTAVVSYYFDGKGVSKDSNKAIEYCKTYASKGSITSQCMLGSMYMELDNLEESYYWYRIAAENGASNAQVKIGEFYENGVVVEQNIEEAKKWYTFSFEQGDAEGQFHFGMLLDGEKRYQEAMDLFLFSANSGSADAENQIGIYYHNGITVERNLEIARQWYQKAINKNLAAAICNMGETYEDDENYVETLKYFKEAAFQQYPKAECKLGIYYLYGLGTDKNLTEAERWLKKAESDGIQDAIYYLGEYSDVEKSYCQAFKYYMMAANQGFDEAQNKVGLYYDNGTGVAANPAKAKEYYTLAANQNLPVACYNLAITIENEGDTSGALAWYKKAAELGFEDANKEIQRLS